jgi:hypothetical protein
MVRTPGRIQGPWWSKKYSARIGWCSLILKRRINDARHPTSSDDVLNANSNQRFKQILIAAG